MDVVAIQVMNTMETDQGFEMVTHKSPEAQFYSVYLRAKDGSCKIVEDYPLSMPGLFTGAYTAAMVKAAELSMEHNVPIEAIK